MARRLDSASPGCFLIGGGCGAMVMFILMGAGVVTTSTSLGPFFLFWVLLVLAWLIGPIQGGAPPPEHQSRGVGQQTP